MEVLQKKESKFDDRNNFLSFKQIRKANSCTTMLLVAKNVIFDHGETQPADGIVPGFKYPWLSYMVLHLYSDARGMYE